MAKKKSSTKKHKFKYAEAPSQVVGPTATEAGPTVSQILANSKGRSAVAVSDSRDFSYVYTDLKKISVLAVSLVGLELILWWLLAQPTIGPAVYRLINV